MIVIHTEGDTLRNISLAPAEDGVDVEGGRPMSSAVFVNQM